MRLLFFLCLATASLCASAQTDETHQRQQLQKAITKQLAEEQPLPTIRKVPDTTGLRPHRPLAHRKAPGVYALPLDNMPCIVPDTNGIAAIPNATPFVYPYRKDMPKAEPKAGDIPNATPFKIIPKDRPSGK